MVNRLYVPLIVLIISLFLTGCYDTKELDDMAYVVGVGIDKGEGNFLKITLQIAIPMKIAGNGGDPKESFFIKSIDAPNLQEGLNRFNSTLSKGINLSHAKVIIFSEEIAKKFNVDVNLEAEYCYYIILTPETSREDFHKSFYEKLQYLLSHNPLNPDLSRESAFPKDAYVIEIGPRQV